MGPCMCGDIYCHSCGSAQGTLPPSGLAEDPETGALYCPECDADEPLEGGPVPHAPGCTNGPLDERYSWETDGP